MRFSQEVCGVQREESQGHTNNRHQHEENKQTREVIRGKHGEQGQVPQEMDGDCTVGTFVPSKSHVELESSVLEVGPGERCVGHGTGSS